MIASSQLYFDSLRALVVQVEGAISFDINHQNELLLKMDKLIEKLGLFVNLDGLLENLPSNNMKKKFTLQDYQEVFKPYLHVWCELIDYRIAIIERVVEEFSTVEIPKIESIIADTSKFSIGENSTQIVDDQFSRFSDLIHHLLALVGLFVYGTQSKYVYDRSSNYTYLIDPKLGTVEVTTLRRHFFQMGLDKEFVNNLSTSVLSDAVSFRSLLNFGNCLTSLLASSTSDKCGLSQSERQMIWKELGDIMCPRRQWYQDFIGINPKSQFRYFFKSTTETYESLIDKFQLSYITALKAEDGGRGGLPAAKYTCSINLNGGTSKTTAVRYYDLEAVFIQKTYQYKDTPLGNPLTVFYHPLTDANDINLQKAVFPMWDIQYLKSYPGFSRSPVYRLFPQEKAVKLFFLKCSNDDCCKIPKPCNCTVSQMVCYHLSVNLSSSSSGSSSGSGSGSSSSGNIGSSSSSSGSGSSSSNSNNSSSGSGSSSSNSNNSSSNSGSGSNSGSLNTGNSMNYLFERLEINKMDNNAEKTALSESYKNKVKLFLNTIKKLNKLTECGIYKDKLELYSDENILEHLVEAQSQDTNKRLLLSIGSEGVLDLLSSNPKLDWLFRLCMKIPSEFQAAGVSVYSSNANPDGLCFTRSVFIGFYIFFLSSDITCKGSISKNTPLFAVLEFMDMYIPTIERINRSNKKYKPFLSPKEHHETKLSTRSRFQEPSQLKIIDLQITYPQECKILIEFAKLLCDLWKEFTSNNISNSQGDKLDPYKLGLNDSLINQSEHLSTYLKIANENNTSYINKNLTINQKKCRFESDTNDFADVRWWHRIRVMFPEFHFILFKDDEFSEENTYSFDLFPQSLRCKDDRAMRLVNRTTKSNYDKAPWLAYQYSSEHAEEVDPDWACVPYNSLLSINHLLRTRKMQVFIDTAGHFYPLGYRPEFALSVIEDLAPMLRDIHKTLNQAIRSCISTRYERIHTHMYSQTELQTKPLESKSQRRSKCFTEIVNNDIASAFDDIMEENNPNELNEEEIRDELNEDRELVLSEELPFTCFTQMSQDLVSNSKNSNSSSSQKNNSVLERFCEQVRKKGIIVYPYGDNNHYHMLFKVSSKCAPELSAILRVSEEFIKDSLSRNIPDCGANLTFACTLDRKSERSVATKPTHTKATAFLKNTNFSTKSDGFEIFRLLFNKTFKYLYTGGTENGRLGTLREALKKSLLKAKATKSGPAGGGGAASCTFNSFPPLPADDDSTLTRQSMLENYYTTNVKLSSNADKIKDLDLHKIIDFQMLVDFLQTLLNEWEKYPAQRVKHSVDEIYPNDVEILKREIKLMQEFATDGKNKARDDSKLFRTTYKASFGNALKQTNNNHIQNIAWFYRFILMFPSIKFVLWEEISLGSYLPPEDNRNDQCWCIFKFYSGFAKTRKK